VRRGEQIGLSKARMSLNKEIKESQDTAVKKKGEGQHVINRTVK